MRDHESDDDDDEGDDVDVDAVVFAAPKLASTTS